MVVTRKAGEAIMRGAHVYAPGVLAASQGLTAGDTVAVSIARELPGAARCRTARDPWRLQHSISFICNCYPLHDTTCVLCWQRTCQSYDSSMTCSTGRAMCRAASCSGRGRGCTSSYNEQQSCKSSYNEQQSGKSWHTTTLHDRLQVQARSVASAGTIGCKCRHADL